MYDPSVLYTDPILSNFSSGWAPQNFYAQNILPVTPVDTPSGRYRVYDRSSWVIFPDRREPGTVANEVRGGKWSEDTFITQEHALQVPVFDEERQNLTSLGGLANAAFGGDLQLDPEEDAVALVTGSLVIGWEKRTADLIRNTANYGAGHTTALGGSTQWDLYAQAGSDPVETVRTAVRKIIADTNRPPNTMLIPLIGASYIENHPKVIDRFKSFALTMPNAFQTLCGFEGNIYLVDSVYNAADNIEATESITSLWGKDVWLGIVDAEPGQRTKTYGKTFAMPYPDGSIRPTDRWREDARKADLFRVSYKYDLKVTSNVAGYLIQTAFSAGAW